jgi:hypothetical protein
MRRYRRARYCDGLARRDFLAAGALGIGSLGLADLLQLEVGAAPARKRPLSVILLFMGGGASHLDTFDLKPDAPAEYRGMFRPIRTSVPGIEISDGLPKLARQMHHMALIRSITHPQDEHQQAAHFMLTGWMPGGVVFNNEHPSLGSVVAREVGAGATLPYVVIRDPAVFVNRHHGASFLGAAFNPLHVQAPFRATNVEPPEDLVAAPGLNGERIARRRTLSDGLDRDLTARLGGGDDGLQAASATQQRAFDLLTSARGAGAFDLTRETEKVRDRYGRTLLGQGCLMARRLVESGVRFVTISRGGWDTHADNFEAMDEELLPDLDSSLSALLEDLHRRGLLESTLVLWSGEFGRTPKMNKDGGRDHWPFVMTLAAAGGGIRAGQVVGASDARAEYPAERPLRPEDVWATMFHLLGIEHHSEYSVPESFEFKAVPRRVPILGVGEPIRELL